MKRIVLLIIGLQALIPFICKGQDVIVKKDGKTIIAKVLKVGNTEIEYKKQSNLNGPLYTINVSDVQSINYSNGEIDRFNEISSASIHNNNQDNIYDEKVNKELIGKNNNVYFRYIGNVKNKPAKYQYRVLGIHSDSKIAREEASIFATQNSGYWVKFSGRYILETEMFLHFINRSDEIIYIDLANCFFKMDRTAKTFYENTTYMTSKNKNVGADINVGSITGVIGVGGAVGSIADGVNVSGGKGGSTSVIKHSDRIVAVAPHSEYVFPAFVFYDSSESMFPIVGNENCTIGSIQKFNQPQDINESPWCLIVSYSYDNNFSYKKQLTMGLFVSTVVGLPGTLTIKDTDDLFEYKGEKPLSYMYKTRKN